MMPRKRLIFTLLYDSGYFMLSRNFRLQKVGDLHWLTTNYDFSRISHSIDELIVLDVSRNERDQDRFSDTLKSLVKHIFVPVAVGGGITNLETATRLLNSGADKLVVNSVLHSDPSLVEQLVKKYGSQCVVVSIDFRRELESFAVYSDSGSKRSEYGLAESIAMALKLGAGEIYLNSMDRDGTGNGYELEVVEMLGENLFIPLIMAGGAGNVRHLVEGIANPVVDAVATANLFNFIGDGLPLARQGMIDAGIDLAIWNPGVFGALKNVCSHCTEKSLSTSTKS